MTLVINAPTTGFVIRKLGLAKEQEMAIRMLKKHMDNHDTKAKEFITAWHEEREEHGGDHIHDQGKIDLRMLKNTKE